MEVSNHNTHLGLKKLKEYHSSEGIIKDLRNLEKENLLKNAFVIEIQEKLERCYDSEGKFIASRAENLIDYLERHLYGVSQNTETLYNYSCTVNMLCEYIETEK